MDAYHLSVDDDRLADLVSRVEAGDDVDLVRAGRVVARIVGVAPTTALDQRFDWKSYRRSIRGMTPYAGNSVVDMRRNARY